MYRVKQFLWSVFSKVTTEDKLFVTKYLNEKELSLFNELSRGEKKHSIKVARDIETNYHNFFKKLNKDSEHKNILIKVGLLHDIGKVTKRLNVIDKSVLVILNNLTKGKLKDYSKIKKIDVYYNHGSIGSKILSELGYQDYWLWVVENHHNKSIDNEEINVLRHFDDLY